MIPFCNHKVWHGLTRHCKLIKSVPEVHLVNLWCQSIPSVVWLFPCGKIEIYGMNTNDWLLGLNLRRVAVSGRPLFGPWWVFYSVVRGYWSIIKSYQLVYLEPPGTTWHKRCFLLPISMISRYWPDLSHACLTHDRLAESASFDTRVLEREQDILPYSGQ